MKTLYINLTPFKSLRGSALIGRDMGSYVREVLLISSIDEKIKNNQDLEMEIQFPDDVSSITDSFMKGLLKDTYIALGYDTFVARVKFYTKNEFLKKELKEDIRRFIDVMKAINS